MPRPTEAGAEVEALTETDIEPADLEDDEPEEAARSTSPYVTPAGAERLRNEFKRLVSVERPKVTAEVSVAAAMGDRSENAEYIYGKKRLREIDRRLRFLSKRLEKLKVVNPADQKDTGRIYFGATVLLENGDDLTQVSYQLVGVDETDVKTGRISIDSPVGKALLGKKKDDTVTVMRPKGEVDFTIIGIRYA